MTSKPCSSGFSQSPMRPAPASALPVAKRLDQRLAACALIEEFDVEIVLGVDALGDAEAERRVAGGDLRPGEPIFGAGAAIAGEKTWRLSTPPAAATPTAPTVFRSVRRDGWTVVVISLLMEDPFMWV